MVILKYLKQLMLNNLIILLSFLLITSCDDNKKDTDNKLVDILEVKNIYNCVKAYYIEESELPTADEIIINLDNLYFSSMKRSPQYSNFKGYIYYLDKAFDIKSKTKLIFSMYKNYEGEYNVILSNGDLISVKKLPKIQGDYFHLTRNE